MSARGLARRPRSVPTTALALGLAVTALVTAGCGGVFDVAYLASDKRTTETVQERSPTGQVHTGIEYEGRADPGGVVAKNPG